MEHKCKEDLVIRRGLLFFLENCKCGDEEKAQE
jgi:hypothetical protein